MTVEDTGALLFVEEVVHAFHLDALIGTGGDWPSDLEAVGDECLAGSNCYVCFGPGRLRAIKGKAFSFIY